MTTQITPGEVVECDSIFSKSIYSDGVTKRGDPNNYQDRLRTYRRDPYPWPLLHPCPEDLAKAGFIYTGQGTQVHCLSCGIYVEDWNDPRIDPVRKHYICNRGCEFLLKHCAQRVRDIYIGSRYSDASLRLSSFTNWPRSAPVPSDLASAGFYYTGEGSKVCCFSCTIAYADWKPADIPVLIHRQLNPSCEFLAELFSEKNIASFPTTCAPDAAMRLPDYSSPELRLMSFRHKQWKNDVVTKEELADAGLYLVELPDVVRCYSCGVELRDWVPGDTAMGKHEKKSPQCPFVRQHQLVGPTFKYTVSIDTTNSSGLSSDLQKQKPVYGEGLFPVEQYRRHSDQGIYLPPTYLGQMGLGQTISVPPSYARSNSFPKQTHNLELPAGSVLCSEDVKTDSPSPRWMLDAGVDIRLPPSLDLRRRPPSSMTSYTVEPPKSVPRSMVTSLVLLLSLCFTHRFLFLHTVGEACLLPSYTRTFIPHHTPFPIFLVCHTPCPIFLLCHTSFPTRHPQCTTVLQSAVPTSITKPSQQQQH